jgi:hypothetical protein
VRRIIKLAVPLAVGLFATSSCTSTQTTTAASPPDRPNQSVEDYHPSRGPTRYGYYSIDIPNQRISNIFWSGRTIPLENCNTVESYCIKSEELNFAIPKSCSAVASISPGDEWVVEGVRMRAVWRESNRLILHRYDPNGLYLINVDNPHITFKYQFQALGTSHNGLMQLYIDTPEWMARPNARSFAEIARTGELSSDRFTIDQPEGFNTIHGYNLDDERGPLFPCQNSAPIGSSPQQ